MHGRHAIVEQIDSSQIHLWLAYPAEIADPHLLAEYRSLLSEEELEKQARLYFERDRHSDLVTRAMVRTVLSKYVDVAPREWRFEVNGYGKPSIALELNAAHALHFNVSHTDGLVVLGVVRARTIGVDVENVLAREVSIEIADRYFATAEVAALRALPPWQQQQRFFEYWTLKESYVKARGRGLSIPLDQFAFDLEEATRIKLAVNRGQDDDGACWAFWQLRLAQQHQIAVCAAQTSSDELHLAPLRTWPR
jgi:4'-phosphopantetheinyl transferase